MTTGSTSSSSESQAEAGQLVTSEHSSQYEFEHEQEQSEQFKVYPWPYPVTNNIAHYNQLVQFNDSNSMGKDLNGEPEGEMSHESGTSSADEVPAYGANMLPYQHVSPADGHGLKAEYYTSYSYLWMDGMVDGIEKWK